MAPTGSAIWGLLKEFQGGVTEVVEDSTKPMPATAPRSRRQRLILTTRHPSWQRRSWSRGQKIVYTTIAAAGNALLDELEVDDAQFIEAACNGSIGETADCAALS
jgi:hypothetical protein